MLKVLLVDDDSIVLEGLKQLVPWSELGMELIGIAFDGFSAIEIVDKEKPEMIIADIAMPVMSGLEFARRAKELIPDVFIVFLSGHADFNYAKQAIQMNAGDYLLKPVNYNELRLKLKEYGKIVSERMKIKNKIRNSARYLNNELMRQWLYGESEADSVETVLKDRKLLTDEFSLCVAIIEIDDIELKFSEYDQEEREKVLTYTKKIIIDWLDSRHKDLYCKTDNDHIAIISINEKENLTTSLEELIEYVTKKISLSITIGLGLEVKRWKQAGTSFSQAKKALSFKMFNGKGKVILYSNTEIKKDKNNEKYLKEILEILFASVKDYRIDDIQIQLDKLFIFLKEIHDKMTVYNTTLYLVSKLDDFLNTLNEDLFLLLNFNRQSLNILYKFETIDDVEIWISNIMKAVAEQIKLKLQSGKSLIIDKVEKYVTIHLEENVTLKEVAENFSISPNYLGSLFKEETGENFSNYMGQMRIKKVGELLEDTSLKIYEVADRLGYKNMTYFNMKFKEYFSVSPRDYRKKRGD
ncbi:MAG: response regulator transcription factor [Clostridium sp.]|uniref:response regulator transcription factor n=1 Tax=Clostridium sp. TaxID=1506 RepID=UPI003D6D990B